jgi:hypothetical protein
MNVPNLLALFLVETGESTRLDATRLKELLVMQRTWILAALGIPALAVGAFLAFRSPTTAAQPGDPEKNKPDAVVSTQLPIGMVVLYSSGVGFFQREGTVDGNSRVDLSFPSADINDLIKSMILRDMDGGRIAAVSYDSNAPIERTLRSYAIDLTANPTFGKILTQARGEKVEVVLANAGAGAGGTLNGTIVGLEKQKVPAGKDAIETEVLNLWCADGVRAIRLNDVLRVRFTNPVLEGEFKKALETLALSHDTQKKAVSLRFEGEGKRKVKVGYVIENPIWKTSYRLVLSQKKEEKPYLQGWAVVENATDEDWKDVRMALVSGRPISFQMDLYTPLYVNRPVVVPELFASLRPVAYSGSMDDQERALTGMPGKPGDRADKGKDSKGGRGKRGEGKEGRAKADAGGGYGYEFGRETKKMLDERLNLGGSVASAATASKLGDFFQYTIDKPVNLPRQKSALLPIVAKEVQGDRLSIYNEKTQAKFPLLGLRFKNTSGLHLMQGPITVFEGSAYSGDARILDLQPNEDRLLSFAVDLGTEVVPAPINNVGRMTHLKSVKGVLYTTTKERQGRTYTIKNRNDQERVMLVEHPVNNAFTLVDTPKPVETASDVQRFQLKVPAGASKTLSVIEERDVRQTISISTQNDEQIRVFMSQTVASKKMKEGLQKAMELRWTTAKTTREIEENQRQLNVLTADQDRLRRNLKEVPANSKVAKIYLDKLEAQEKKIEKYQEEIKKLQGTQHTQQKAFDDFLVSFDAE